MRSDWTITRLGDLIDLRGGLSYKKEFVGKGSSILVGMGAVSHSDRFIVSGVRTYDGEASEKYKVSPGDLVIATRQQSDNLPILGFPAIIPPSLANKQIIVATNLYKVTKKSDIDLTYIFWLLRGKEYRTRIIEATKGTTVKMITKDAIEDFMFYCPSPTECKNISRILNNISDRIDLLKQTNQTLEAIAQTIFKSWFVNFDPVHAKQQGIACVGIDAETAELFPNSFEDSELGQIPKGWRVLGADDILKRLSVGKKYEQKTSKQKGCVPILDQGKSGVIGYHDDLPSIIASPEEPVIVFANHTCYMRLISFPFSTIQNVLPFTGKGVDTIWLYYATMNKITFQEYKGHWPDFARQNVIVPSNKLTFAYSERVSPLIRKIFTNCIYIEILTKVRDTLLPRLISGKLDVSAIEAQLEEMA